MELTFEFTKELGTGAAPLVFHNKDNSIVMLYGDALVMKGSTGDYNDMDPNATVFSVPTVVTSDTPEGAQNIHLTGGMNWLSWRDDQRHRVALYPEAAKVMKIAFFKGMILGIQVRHMFLKSEPLGDVLSMVPQRTKDEGFNIDYWNGYVIGLCM